MIGSLGRTSRHALLIIPAVTGIATLFLPFTFDTSPWHAKLDRDLWWVADPFFLTLLITVLSARKLVWGALSPAERIVAYLAGATSIGVWAWFGVTRFSEWSQESQSVMAMTASFAMLVGGVVLLICSLRSESGRSLAPVVALEVAYLGNSAFCLVDFAGGWQKGAYYALVTSVLYLVQAAHGSCSTAPWKRC